MPTPAVFNYHIHGAALDTLDCLVVAIGKIIKWFVLLLVVPVNIAAILLSIISSFITPIPANVVGVLGVIIMLIYYVVIIVNFLNTVYANLKIVFYYRRVAFKVTERSYPEVYNLIRTACERLSISKIPEVFIIQDPRFNALTAKSGRGFILINSSVIEQFTSTEALFLIGHELSHIKMSDKLDVTGREVVNGVINGGFVLPFFHRSCTQGTIIQSLSL